MRLSEVSPNTLEGSFSDDLVLGKLWLIRKLAELDREFGTVYVLGSWFGNLGLLMAARELPFRRIVNVDLDGKAIGSSRWLCDRLGIEDRVSHRTMDANDLSYDDLGPDGLVINTSCNNIAEDGWFTSIPSGTVVALQSRDGDPGAINQHASVGDLCDRYPLATTIYRGRLRLRDGDGEYDRFMAIGRR